MDDPQRAAPAGIAGAAAAPMGGEALLQIVGHAGIQSAVAAAEEIDAPAHPGSMAKAIGPRNNPAMATIRLLTAATPSRRRSGALRALPLVGAQYREHGIELSRERLLRALREACNPRRGLVLLAFEREPVGVAVVAYTWTVERGGLVAWLDELYVVPARRGRGVGKQLLTRAMGLARRAGCTTMELEVVRGHERSARLYRRAGFRRLPRTRYSKELMGGNRR